MTTNSFINTDKISATDFIDYVLESMIDAETNTVIIPLSDGELGGVEAFLQLKLIKPEEIEIDYELTSTRTLQ